MPPPRHRGERGRDQSANQQIVIRRVDLQRDPGGGVEECQSVAGHRARGDYEGTRFTAVGRGKGEEGEGRADSLFGIQIDDL